jgi:hypothetical protein
MPAPIRSMLITMDKGWMERLGGLTWQSGINNFHSFPFCSARKRRNICGRWILDMGAVIAFGLAYWMDDFVNVFWFATRSQVLHLCLCVYMPACLWGWFEVLDG